MTTPKQPHVSMRAIDSEKGTTRFVVSTSIEARDGHIVDQSSWNLEPYKRNPVVLWAHDYSLPPIGRSEEIEVVNDQLESTVVWDTGSDLGAQVARQYAEGFLSAVSVGWMHGKVTPRSEFGGDHPWHGERGVVFQDNEMLEHSAVPVPTDAHALAARGLPLPKPGNLEMEELVQWVKHGLNSSPEGTLRAELLELLQTDGDIRRQLQAMLWASPLGDADHIDDTADTPDWFDDLG